MKKSCNRTPPVVCNATKVPASEKVGKLENRQRNKSETKNIFLCAAQNIKLNQLMTWKDVLTL